MREWRKRAEPYYQALVRECPEEAPFLSQIGQSKDMLWRFSSHLAAINGHAAYNDYSKINEPLTSLLLDN